MERDQYLEVLEREGTLLADTAEAGGLDTDVMTCPEWQIRDLLIHVGYVHRWALAHVVEARPDRAPFGEAGGVVVPGDRQLLDWFREGHADLVRALRTADPSLSCWTFLPAPSALLFWARRQAHETAIHRADGEAGTGSITRFDPEFAADGIDELVMGFAPTPRAKVATQRRRVLAIETTDTEHRWVIGLGPEGIDTQRGAGPHDSRLTGTAADLYLFLWNRVALEDADLEVSGDEALPTLWGSSLRV